ncbi:MAG: hypothetical protein RSC73_05535, partial [Ruthenibacterium sp.]
PDVSQMSTKCARCQPRCQPISTRRQPNVNEMRPLSTPLPTHFNPTSAECQRNAPAVNPAANPFQPDVSQMSTQCATVNPAVNLISSKCANFDDKKTKYVQEETKKPRTA